MQQLLLIKGRKKKTHPETFFLWSANPWKRHLSKDLPSSTMTNTVEETFRIITTTLRFVGLYPDKHNSLMKKIWKYTVYFLEVLLTILTLTTLLLERNLDTMVMNEMVIFFSEAAASCFKIIPFLIDSHKIKRCINYFGHRRFAPKHPEAAKIMDDCMGVCRRNIRVFFGIVGIAVCFWNLFPLIKEKYTLQVNIWLPYELSGFGVFLSTYLYIVASTNALYCLSLFLLSCF